MGRAAVGVPLLRAVPQHPAKVFYFPGLLKSRLQSRFLNALLNNFLKRQESLNCCLELYQLPKDPVFRGGDDELKSYLFGFLKCVYY